MQRTTQIPTALGLLLHTSLKKVLATKLATYKVDYECLGLMGVPLTQASVILILEASHSDSDPIRFT